MRIFLVDKWLEITFKAAEHKNDISYFFCWESHPRKVKHVYTYLVVFNKKMRNNVWYSESVALKYFLFIYNGFLSKLTCPLRERCQEFCLPKRQDIEIFYQMHWPNLREISLNAIHCELTCAASDLLTELDDVVTPFWGFSCMAKRVKFRFPRKQFVYTAIMTS